MNPKFISEQNAAGANRTKANNSSIAQAHDFDHPAELDLHALGYRFPGEFEAHEATWLSWPHNPNTWPGLLNQIIPVYAEFAAGLTHEEQVHINVNHTEMADAVRTMIQQKGGGCR